MLRNCSRRRRAALAAPLLSAALLTSGCATLSVDEERQLGMQMSREIRSELRFVRDATVVAYVRELGDEIVRAAGPQPFEYHFYVVEDDQINAFAAPGGYVYVHTATILKARNASELAGVMAHEIGHVVKRHVARNYNRQRNTGLLYKTGVLATAVIAGGAMANAASMLGQLPAMAYLNSFTREGEDESDAFAVEVLPKADWDANGLVTFFQTLRMEGGAQGPSFLSSHPATEDRIAKTSALIAELPPMPDLRVNDGGKFELIQRRIRLITGESDPGVSRPEPEPL